MSMFAISAAEISRCTFILVVLTFKYCFALQDTSAAAVRNNLSGAAEWDDLGDWERRQRLGGYWAGNHSVGSTGRLLNSRPFRCHTSQYYPSLFLSSRDAIFDSALPIVYRHPCRPV